MSVCLNGFANLTCCQSYLLVEHLLILGAVEVVDRAVMFRPRFASRFLANGICVWSILLLPR